MRTLLAQLKPAAGALTYFYSAQDPVTNLTLVICNQSATGDTFRLSLAPHLTADVPEHCLFYDYPLLGNDTFFAAMEFALNQGDGLYVRSANGTSSFQLFAEPAP